VAKERDMGRLKGSKNKPRPLDSVKPLALHITFTRKQTLELQKLIGDMPLVPTYTAVAKATILALIKTEI
jgi:hypothetical protein